MGPIERELRKAPMDNDRCYEWLRNVASVSAFRFVKEARKQLGFEALWDAANAGAVPDAMSEAIEAAEALGL